MAFDFTAFFTAFGLVFSAAITALVNFLAGIFGVSLTGS